MTIELLRPNEETLHQYRLLRDGHGFVALDAWSCLEICGEDRKSFLHNFCTNGINTLQNGQGCEAFITDVKGKVLGHVLVLCSSDRLLAVTVSSRASAVVEHLDRYVIREDVEIRDASDGVYLQFTTATDFSAADSTSSRISTDWLKPNAGSVLVDAIANKDGLLEELDAAGVRECNREALQIARIESGTPICGIDFDETNLPQEVGRDEQAISFTKGCYLGQETVARIDALGHVNKLLSGVAFPGDSQPQPGVELKQDGKPVGFVTSVAFSPLLEKPVGLAMIRTQFDEVGTTLESDTGPCEVIALPPNPE